jgi:two-component system, NtrC family, response regulator AtoC
MARILVVDDEIGFRSYVAEALELQGHDVEQAGDGLEAKELLKKRSFHVLLSDLKMPKMDGMELLGWIRAEQPEIEVIMLTAHGSVGTAVDAMKIGAFDYLEKPLESPDALRIMVARAVERHRLCAHKEVVSESIEVPLTFGAPAMIPIVEGLRKVAVTDATVLLFGESGVGKEVAAKAIHRWSPRAKGPFIAVNCAALSDHLLESELFGHEKGAFTGASARRRGRIELADGGICFLDEVGELKPELQTKLLRVLQEKTFERVGGERTIEADVRWIAATNRDLQKMVIEGSFREDLYHRLALFPVRLPPLRERREDIPFLAEALLERIGRDVGRNGLRLDESAKQALIKADWPGNVRELANTLERAVIMADNVVLSAGHLLPGIGSIVDQPLKSIPQNGNSATLEEMECAAIKQALQQVGGNRKMAAEQLGIGLRTLYDKLKRYNLS